MLSTIVFFLLLIIFILWKMFVVVPMREVCIVQRFGKYRKTLNPGFHFLIPFIDSIAYKQEIREQVLDVPSQSCITKDNVQMQVDGLVYLKITDAYKASYGIGDYRNAAVNLAQTTMRSEIGRLNLDDTFSERDSLNENIVREIDKASDPWGIKVMRYEIRNITPSLQIIETLEKQMEAVRQKRAEVIRTEGEKQAKINESQGERTSAINVSEAIKIKKINEATGKAKSIELIAKATAEGIKKIALAINQSGGRDAVKTQLASEYLEEFQNIIAKADVSILPSDLANLKGLADVIGFSKNDKANSSSKSGIPKVGRKQNTGR